MSYAYTKRYFIDNYLQALNNGDAAIFAGAGLSVPSGCVNWKQLLNGIAAELALDIEKESDLVAILSTITIKAEIIAQN